MNQTNLDHSSFSSVQKTKNTALNFALNYLSHRARTVFEIKTYIQKKGFNQDTIQYVLDYLTTQNYLNDYDYSKSFLELRSKYKPKSSFALKYELKSKGVDESIIDTLLLDYDDDELAWNAVKTKIKQWQHFDKDKFNKKVTNFLRYRGFSYTVCISTLNRIKQDMRNENEN